MQEGLNVELKRGKNMDIKPRLYLQGGEQMKFTVKTSLAMFLFIGAVSVNGVRAEVSDYDPVTGEPECIKCHTPDRKLSIDYTLDDACSECHGSQYSDKFMAINGRYRQEAKNGQEYSDAVKTVKRAVEKKPGSIEGMALIPAGPFTMGSDGWWPKSQPQHKVDVGAFYMDKYEVTNRRYRAFVDATNGAPPENWTGGNIPAGKENHPVVFVSWYDADAFCKWEGKRLPTEVEWEKAARGVDGRTFPWGDKFAKEKGNTPQYGRGDTMQVGSFDGGKSPYGVYDMAGNAWEWVEDWFKPYPGNTHPDENYGEKYKVLRGGSWYDCTYYKCGISAPTYNRIFFNVVTKNNNFGFRCAKDK